MNGVHDLGGMQGFGPIVDEPGEPCFHAPWEGRMLALQRAILFMRVWNLDAFRYAQERLPADAYLSVSYYHRWLLGLTSSALEHGLVTPEELDAGHSLGPTSPVQRTMGLGDIEGAKIRPPFGRTPTTEARFAPGALVRTTNIHPIGHTRLPRYARDKIGRVEAVHGCHAYPDGIVAGDGSAKAWLYTVAFDGRRLWGEHADPTLTVSIEAFEPYLEPA
jgi:nitrile hydratase subunit beta